MVEEEIFSNGNDKHKRPYLFLIRYIKRVPLCFSLNDRIKIKNSLEKREHFNKVCQEICLKILKINSMEDYVKKYNNLNKFKDNVINEFNKDKKNREILEEIRRQSYINSGKHSISEISHIIMIEIERRKNEK